MLMLHILKVGIGIFIIIRRTKLFRGFFDDVTDNNNENDTVICPIHGPYPKSMKAFGCPECIKEQEDNENMEKKLENSKIARYSRMR